jgi:hypothetical protein
VELGFEKGLCAYKAAALPLDLYLQPHKLNLNWINYSLLCNELAA